MRFQALLRVGIITTSVGCSSGTPIDTDPFPDGEVKTRQSGVVVDDEGVARTTGERSTAATLGIPPGHLPAAGQCRVWEPGRPPGQQRHLPNGACERVERAVEPGQWLVYRPGENKKIVEVRMYDAGSQRYPAVSLIRIFDLATGELLEEIDP